MKHFRRSLPFLAVAGVFIGFHSSAWCDASPVASWTFEEVQSTASEPLKKKKTTRYAQDYKESPSGILNKDSGDAVFGLFELVDGVSGKAMKGDGFSSKVVRVADRLPSLSKGFSLEAWVAPQEYSQNQSAIVDCSQGRETGFFLGIDKAGRLLVQANIGGKWSVCRSSDPLPLLRWSHVAATFDPATGLSVYVDGKVAGSSPVEGSLVPAPETDLWIGMSQMNQTPDGHSNMGDPLPMVFDGLIDEVRLYDAPRSASEIAADVASVTPSVAQPLKFRVLPSGPQEGKRFGAFHARLEYCPEWDAQWRVGDTADVVVTFDHPGANFVFWRGTGYIPHWVTKNGVWYNNQFVERMGNSDGCRGCVEPMSDKRCRFSHVRVIHSTPARTLIHWRYAPVGVNYKQPFVDPYSGQGDWVDEYYWIYPDMTGIRSMTLHSTAIDYFADHQESIIVHQPGRKPEDNIEAKAVSIANLKGETVDYTYPEVAEDGGGLKGLPSLPCIQVVNLKSELRPFIVIPPSPKVSVGKFKGHSPFSIFKWWNHWPVSQGRSPSSDALDANRPSHSSVSFWKHWEPYRSTRNSETLIMMHGMTDKGAKDLTGIAKAWISPAPASVTEGALKDIGYDMEQKAYVFEVSGEDADVPMRIRLEASSDSPLVHPVLVIRYWPEDTTAKVDVAGLKAEQIKVGLERALDGNTLVVWLGLDVVTPVEVQVTKRTL